MADVSDRRTAPPHAGAVLVSGLFRDRYPEMVRLADLLGADDPEDIAQEAFARLMRKAGTLRDPASAIGYVRSTVCNLVRNRHRHLRVVRLRLGSLGLARGHDEMSSEHAVMVREDHRQLLTALAALPARRREAIVLRYWLDLPEREIAAAMGVSPGTVKSHVSRGLDALGEALEGKL
ncbi:MAG TPA: sigma-70 family RNA polymerase sigma factor [Streptosporangiaceae bacterium]|nr:sigma-70 family RNA polymerase sigma factor [Streptosporangiaceae bacterium]